MSLISPQAQTLSGAIGSVQAKELCAWRTLSSPLHSKAMPVILTTQDEIEVWMTAPAERLGAAPPQDDALS